MENFKQFERGFLPTIRSSKMSNSMFCSYLGLIYTMSQKAWFNSDVGLCRENNGTDGQEVFFIGVAKFLEICTNCTKMSIQHSLRARMVVCGA